MYDLNAAISDLIVKQVDTAKFDKTVSGVIKEVGEDTCVVDIDGPPHTLAKTSDIVAGQSVSVLKPLNTQNGREMKLIVENCVNESALNRALDELTAQLPSIPPGMMFDWLAADGSAVSRTTYAALFGAVGTVYGIGDGSSTFNLPDTRGRVSAGYDASQTEFDVLGEKAGAKTHTLTLAEMPSHNHSLYGHYGSGNGLNTATLNNGTGTGGIASYIPIENTGGGGAHNNLQPYIVIKKIIKY